MENTIQYHIAYDVYFWEEWHENICEEGWDTPEDAERDIKYNLLEDNNVNNLRIVEVTTTYKDVKLIKRLDR